MDIEYIREFIFLSRLLNFSKAADRMHISQPTLSRHLSILEDELGACLFVRSRHAVYLTEEGKIYLPQAEELMIKYDDAMNAIKFADPKLKRNLGVGVLYYQKEFLLDKIGLFISKYPEVYMHYLSATPGELVSALFDDNIDVSSIMHVDFKNSEDLTFFDVYDEPLLLAVPVNHRFANRKYISIREIENQNYINVDDIFYHGYFSYIKNLCESHGVSLLEPELVPDFETQLLYVQAGKGITIITSNMKKHLTGCIPIDILEENFRISRSIAWKTNNTNKALHQFVALLK